MTKSHKMTKSAMTGIRSHVWLGFRPQTGHPSPTILPGHVSCPKYSSPYCAMSPNATNVTLPPNVMQNMTFMYPTIVTLTKVSKAIRF